jgi:hypothetical protein
MTQRDHNCDIRRVLGNQCSFASENSAMFALKIALETNRIGQC